jgi:hypothetical protein
MLSNFCAAALAITGTLGLGAAVGMAVGHADELDTIRLADIPNIDTLPQCSVEDCSDLRIWRPYGQGFTHVGA